MGCIDLALEQRALSVSLFLLLPLLCHGHSIQPMALIDSLVQLNFLGFGQAAYHYSPTHPLPYSLFPGIVSLLGTSESHLRSELGPIDQYIDVILSKLVLQESEYSYMINIKETNITATEQIADEAARVLNAKLQKQQQAAALVIEETMKIQNDKDEIHRQITAFSFERDQIDEMRLALQKLSAIGDHPDTGALQTYLGMDAISVPVLLQDKLAHMIQHITSTEGQMKSSVAHFVSTDIIGTKQKLLQSISLLGRPYDEARLVMAAILHLEEVIKSREREMQEKLAELQQNITHAQRLSDFALSEVVVARLRKIEADGNANAAREDYHTALEMAGVNEDDCQQIRSSIRQIRELLTQLLAVPQTKTFETVQTHSNAGATALANGNTLLQQQQQLKLFDEQIGKIKERLLLVDARIDEANIKEMLAKSEKYQAWIQAKGNQTTLGESYAVETYRLTSLQAAIAKEVGAEREARMRVQDEITRQAREEALFIKVLTLLDTLASAAHSSELVERIKSLIAALQAKSLSDCNAMKEAQAMHARSVAKLTLEFDKQSTVSNITQAMTAFACSTTLAAWTVFNTARETLEKNREVRKEMRVIIVAIFALLELIQNK